MANFSKKQAEKAAADRQKYRQKPQLKLKRPRAVPKDELPKVSDGSLRIQFNNLITDAVARNGENIMATSSSGWSRVDAGQRFTFTAYSEMQRPVAVQARFKQGDVVMPRGDTGAVKYYVHAVKIEQRPDRPAPFIFYHLINEQNGPGNMIQAEESALIPYSAKPKKAVKPKPKKGEVTFESVIIEDGKREQILEALEQVNQHELIFETWGFSETMEKGKGVSMLFYGEPGTGKTLMCQAVANKLGKKLNIVATADIESSAPGEAERNIRKAFKEAKEKDSILLFDECDSLIYNRANVGAILGAQINELLTQLERFDGVTLFTTNRLGTLDEAVNRRLALKLEFAMPSVEERVKIWQRMFPKQAPLAKDINWEKLASIEVTGGYIKNTVLRAARMAAIEKGAKSKKKITMQHLIKALRLEAQSKIDFEDARARHKAAGGIGIANEHGIDPDTGQKVMHRVQSMRVGHGS